MSLPSLSFKRSLKMDGSNNTRSKFLDRRKFQQLWSCWIYYLSRIGYWVQLEAFSPRAEIESNEEQFTWDNLQIGRAWRAKNVSPNRLYVNHTSNTLWKKKMRKFLKTNDCSQEPSTEKSKCSLSHKSYTATFCFFNNLFRKTEFACLIVCQIWVFENDWDSKWFL